MSTTEQSTKPTTGNKSMIFTPATHGLIAHTGLAPNVVTKSNGNTYYDGMLYGRNDGRHTHNLCSCIPSLTALRRNRLAMTPYTTCTSCIPNHYTNCNTCYGFGIYPSRGHNIPIAAHEALANIPNTEPCPECGSTIHGIPTPPSAATSLPL